MASQEQQIQANVSEDNPDEYNEETLERMMLTAIRKTIAVGRYAEKLVALKGLQTISPVGSMIIVDLGNGCRIGGMGNVFNNFISSKNVSGYTGEGSHFASLGDADYDQALVQIVRFDQTFKRSCYDVTRDAMFDEKTDVIFKKKRGKQGKYKPRSKPTVRRPKPKSKYFLKENQCAANVSASITDEEPQEVLNLSQKSGDGHSSACVTEQDSIETENDPSQVATEDDNLQAMRKQNLPQRIQKRSLSKQNEGQMKDPKISRTTAVPENFGVTQIVHREAAQNRQIFVHCEVDPRRTETTDILWSQIDEFARQPSLDSGYSSQISSNSSENGEDSLDEQITTLHSLLTGIDVQVLSNEDFLLS